MNDPVTGEMAAALALANGECRSIEQAEAIIAWLDGPHSFLVPPEYLRVDPHGVERLRVVAAAAGHTVVLESRRHPRVIYLERLPEEDHDASASPS